MMDSVLAHLAFSHMLGIGPVKFARLIETFGSAVTAYGMTYQDLATPLGPSLAQQFVEFRTRFNPLNSYNRYLREGITLAIPGNQSYPPMLRDIPDPPICLYLKGDVHSFSFQNEYYLSIVGSRRPTAYGLQVAKMIARDMVAEGWSIVSGLALGIDAMAHESAIEAGGKTIAFLGCGVNVVYPASNSRLYERILQKGGLIISEFPPGMAVQKGMFVTRNRLISGLSQGTLVVEGTQTSGALITARYAALQGKDVFAVPGQITSAQSEAPSILLKQGAILVTSIQDILSAYHLGAEHIHDQQQPSFDSVDEQRVYDILKSEPLRPDDISEKTSLSVTEVLAILSGLEIKGHIRQSLTGEYQIA